MTQELFGFSREYAKESNVELIPDHVREEVRTKIATVFGNAKYDSTIIIDRRNEQNYESTILCRVVIKNLTSQMTEMLDQNEFYGIHIDKIRSINKGREMELDVKCNEYWARSICTRDGVRSFDHRVTHKKTNHNYKKEFEY